MISTSPGFLVLSPKRAVCVLPSNGRDTVSTDFCGNAAVQRQPADGGQVGFHALAIGGQDGVKVGAVAGGDIAAGQGSLEGGGVDEIHEDEGDRAADRHRAPTPHPCRADGLRSGSLASTRDDAARKSRHSPELWPPSVALAQLRRARPPSRSRPRARIASPGRWHLTAK